MGQVTPTKRIFNIVAIVVFMAFVAMFSYMAVADWLPATLLSVGVALVIRQILQGKTLDVLVCFIVFGGSFLCSFFNFVARIFLPTFFILGSVYFLLRQFFEFSQKLKEEKSPAETVQMFEEAAKAHKAAHPGSTTTPTSTSQY